MLTNIVLSDVQKAAIEQHVLSQYPNEACGLLTTNRYVACNNVHNEPEKNFRFDKRELAQHFGQTVAIVHSHCRNPRKASPFDPRTPSYKDFNNQKLTNKPWLIVACEGLTVSEPLQFPRQPDNNYLQRPFIWFINDCYTLVQDWYRFELGIELKEYVIDKDYEDIRHLNYIFAGNIEAYGFREIKLKDIAEGDLILLDHSGFKENHLGIYTKGQVLHQDTFSVQVPFQTFLGRINKVLTYVG